MSSTTRTALLLLLLLAFVASTPAQDPNACDTPDDYPDVVAGGLDSVMRWGTVGDITAYSIGATTCNLGTCWVDWFASTNAHPVFAQNLFRLKDGRFEQIGQSWATHRFFALSQTACETGCLATNGTHLGVNCSTVNSAAITGGQQYMGPRSDIDASTGAFVFPFEGQGQTGDPIWRRLQVHNDDVDPAQNAGALYFIEGHNIAADDAAAGMAHNNASYRQVNVSPALDLSPTGPTVQEQPAIAAWATLDPEVGLETVDVPDDGRFFVASKATDLGGGIWRYEIAIHNMSSHRSAGSVSVPVPPGTAVTNIGFHDVDYHSGEPYDGTDWTGTVVSGGGPSAVVWTTESFATDPDANALRWGTLYNFRFDADVPPSDGSLTIGLFRPGSPDDVTSPATTPRLCDDDGACDAGETPCNCPADCGAAPSTETVCTDGLDDDCDGLTDCDDADCCGTADCPTVDGDGDTHLACEDCDDADPTVWETPGAVTDLMLDRDAANRAYLGWSAPGTPGAATVLYETFRSDAATGFDNGAVCLNVPDATVTAAVDVPIPAEGEVFHYLVRATNDCPDGLGPLGEGRAAEACP